MMLNKTNQKVFLILLCLLPFSQKANSQSYTVECNKIWGDADTYCAFTSIIKHKGNYLCSFREGVSHIFDEKGTAEGKVRIIASRNGKKWKSVYLGSKKGYDLRDPKMSVMPDGRVMVIFGGSIYQNKKLVGMEPQVCFSTDGIHYSEPQPIQFTDGYIHKRDWLWRVTWHEGTGYAVDYGSDENNKTFLRLYSTTDGIHFSLVCNLSVSDSPNETTIRFLPDGRMSLMVRRDAADCKGYWGTASAPYTQWEWSPMEMRLGGQDFLVHNNKLLVATRSYHLPQCKTALYKGNLKGKLEEVAVLPSHGDSSYPGLLIEGDKLWISYYSCHQGKKAAIYLAKVPLSAFD